MTQQPSKLKVRRLTVPLGGGRRSRPRMSAPLSFDVPAGEVLAVVGPENSGKTALCRALAGLSRARDGLIRVGPTDLAGLPAHQRRIGFASYRTGLIPNRSLADNMALPLMEFGYAEAAVESRVRSALGRLHMEHIRNSLPDALSEAERRLLVIERTLLFEPNLIVLDNPMRGVSGEGRRMIMQRIDEVHRRYDGPIVLAMRHFRDAMQLAGQIAAMDNGTIEQIGPPQALYEAPISVAVVEATGGGNLLPGRVTLRTEDTCLVALDGGFEITCVPDETLDTGDDTVVAFRPDMAALGIAGRHLDNRFQAAIKATCYRGDTIDVRAGGLGSDSLMLRVLNTAVRQSLRRGNKVAVGLTVNACRALPAP